MKIINLPGFSQPIVLDDSTEKKIEGYIRLLKTFPDPIQIFSVLDETDEGREMFSLIHAAVLKFTKKEENPVLAILRFPVDYLEQDVGSAFFRNGSTSVLSFGKLSETDVLGRMNEMVSYGIIDIEEVERKMVKDCDQNFYFETSNWSVILRIISFLIKRRIQPVHYPPLSQDPLL